MEKLEAAGETVLIQGIFLSNNFNQSLCILLTLSFNHPRLWSYRSYGHWNSKSNWGEKNVSIGC